MGDTISDMDIYRTKRQKNTISDSKICITDSKVVEDMTKVDLNRISSKRGNRSMNRLNRTLTIINTLKIKSKKN